MFHTDRVVYEGDTAFGHYTVIDTVYEGRPARVLYSGNRQAAQSGIAKDDKNELLFDYIQRFFELVDGLRPKKLLLIGGGVYTLPMALIKALPSVQIDVVELDPGLDEIAMQYFNFKPSRRLNIIHADGGEYLKSSDQRYDMILVDAFNHTDIPKALTERAAVRRLHDRLEADGLAAINIISTYYGDRSKLIREQFRLYGERFDSVDVFPAGRSLFSLWISQNLVLVGQKGTWRSLNSYLRFGALPPPR